MPVLSYPRLKSIWFFPALGSHDHQPQLSRPLGAWEVHHVWSQPYCTVPGIYVYRTDVGHTIVRLVGDFPAFAYNSSLAVVIVNGRGQLFSASSIRGRFPRLLVGVADVNDVRWAFRKRCTRSDDTVREVVSNLRPVPVCTVLGAYVYDSFPGLSICDFG